MADVSVYLRDHREYHRESLTIPATVSIEASALSRYSVGVNTQSTEERLERVRAAMRQTGLQAWIVYSTDPHMSEYVPERWQARAWLSGFDGSAGTLVVTAGDRADGGSAGEAATGTGGGRAALWTDGRYFLQAEQQLSGSGIELMRLGEPGTPDISGFLAQALGGAEAVGKERAEAAVGASGDTVVGTAADCLSAAQARRLAEGLQRHGLRLQPGRDILEDVWTDRPGLPEAPMREFPAERAGETRRERLQRFRQQAGIGEKTDAAIVCSLDDLAYLLLLRGNDVAYNPVALAYAVVEAQRVRLYLPPEKHTSAQFLARDGIELRMYDQLQADLAALPAGCRVLLDPARTNQAVYRACSGHAEIREQPLPVTLMKARKNPVEIDNIRRAMRLDGAALVGFLHWLKTHPDPESLNEYTVAEKLEGFRAHNPGYQGDSFPTIAGFGPNGAIVHYYARPDSALGLRRDGLLLVDSGAHYECGTTDVTRVVCWDTPTARMRRDYTLVLKGHIALATARFPLGTRGIQLDTLARQALWQDGLDYRHGTGHGVGYCLPVHEGPQSISTRMVDAPLLAGMISSNEPGLYRSGEYGIRIENLILAVESLHAGFLEFETLTLCPLENDLIDTELLSPAELGWVRRYQARVARELSPFLESAQRAFLQEMCRIDGNSGMQEDTAAIHNGSTKE